MDWTGYHSKQSIGHGRTLLNVAMPVTDRHSPDATQIDDIIIVVSTKVTAIVAHMSCKASDNRGADLWYKCTSHVSEEYESGRKEYLQSNVLFSSVDNWGTRFDCSSMEGDDCTIGDTGCTWRYDIFSQRILFGSTSQSVFIQSVTTDDEMKESVFQNRRNYTSFAILIDSLLQWLTILSVKDCLIRWNRLQIHAD